MEEILKEMQPQQEQFKNYSDIEKWAFVVVLLERIVALEEALALARKALSYEIGFIEDHCNEDDKQLLLDKQALKAIEEALK